MTPAEITRVRHGRRKPPAASMAPPSGKVTLRTDCVVCGSTNHTADACGLGDRDGDVWAWSDARRRARA